MKLKNKIILFNIFFAVLIFLSVYVNRIQQNAGLLFAIIVIVIIMYASNSIINFSKANKQKWKDLLLQMNQELYNSRSESEIKSDEEASELLIENLHLITKYVHSINNGSDTNIDIITSTDRTLNSTNLAGEIFTLLEKNKEFEKSNTIVQKDAEQRNWTSLGQAKFAEIQRSNSNNISDLSYQVISNLVKYINANQGGIFILNEKENGEKYFELTGSYAYGRKKFCDNIIQWGEGLIGTCAHEKEYIYMTDIPNDYLKITSGLGQANPRSLLIIPMILEDEIFGIIELASFNQIEQYVIDFVEKVAIIMASSISSVRLSEKTNILLEQMKRQTDILQKQQVEMKMQAEEMMAQDEELRQNLEELQTIQEDAEAKGAEMKGVLNAIDHSMMKAEFSIEGKLIDCNDKFQNVFGFSLNELLDKSLIIFQFENTIEDFSDQWNFITAGTNFECIVKCKNAKNNDIWLIVTFSPILDQHHNVNRILVLANNITEQKNHERLITDQSQKLKEQEEILQFNMEELQATTEQYESMTNNQSDRIIFLEHIFDSIETPITTTDEYSSNITFINKNAEKILGIKRSELNGSVPKPVIEKLSQTKSISYNLQNNKGKFLGEVHFLQNTE